MNNEINLTLNELYEIFTIWNKDFEKNPNEFLQEKDLNNFSLEEATEHSCKYFIDLLEKVRNEKKDI